MKLLNRKRKIFRDSIPGYNISEEINYQIYTKEYHDMNDRLIGIRILVDMENDA